MDTLRVAALASVKVGAVAGREQHIALLRMATVIAFGVMVVALLSAPVAVLAADGEDRGHTVGVVVHIHVHRPHFLLNLVLRFKKDSASRVHTSLELSRQQRLHLSASQRFDSDLLG